MSEIKILKSCTVASGPEAVNVVRMITLARGLAFEIKTGMKLTRGRTCYAIIKSEFGLRGNKKRVLAQFEPLVDAARAQVPVIREEG